MKDLTSCLMLSFILWGCAQMEQEELSQSGEVKFKAVSVSSFSGNIPYGRIEAASTWKHIFKDQARLEVIDKNTGQVYGVDYNPNDFGEGFTISLPYGSYTYTSEVEGGKFRRYLPFRIEGEFILNVESLDLTLNATTDYGLITVKNEYLSGVEIGHGTDSYGMGLLEDGSHYFIYARNGLTANLEIIETVENKLIERQIAVQAYNHYHFMLQLTKGDKDNLIELALGAFELIEEGIAIGEPIKGFFTDSRDEKTYQTVQIGRQTWMAENLAFDPQDPSCADPDFDDIDCPELGEYTWEDAIRFCPEGWHLPSNEEWGELVNYLGGWRIAGDKMKSITGWAYPSTDATNESGFSALPGSQNGVLGSWWSSTFEFLTDSERYVDRFILRSYTRKAEIQRIPLESDVHLPCRCIKD